MDPYTTSKGLSAFFREKKSPIIIAFFHRSLVDIHQEFALRMGCPLKKETDIEASVKCLQEKSVSDLMNGLKIFDQCNSK